jgi:hypothetical protein
MNLKFPLFLAAFAATALTLAAEESAAMKTMQAALKFRAEMAMAVGKNAEAPQSALKRLRDSGAASGMAVGRDADLGYAALDVGHKLLAIGRPDAAEVFFRAAELAFEQVANRTPRAQAREKAQYLQKLALVRGNFLNKPAQAKADIDDAILLQPEDKSLEQSRRQLARGRGEQFKRTGKN